MEKERYELDTTALKAFAEACACSQVRKAARVITQFYDRCLQPTGLRMTQHTVLVVIALSEQETVMRLAEKLAMDRSALARALKPLESQGLVTVEAGSDRRTRVVRLTEQGRQALREAHPYWLQAQKQVMAHFGEQQTQALLAELKKVEALELLL
ncbi:MarR family transcriptional regulator [Ktedonobacter sp. SOSP1-85]|uniref:MarR family winged helix-turn-helix transcriptional regulator n=1 Tax=Ktedonobacter sp. SOSP1-85 TaxID=2778367 RepID=UPI00191699ED|nr:MarR family winged helix-turn-helix transcriptional regulator [Ktedonobacter sp. SOSP1-85]GHO81536.1 MarR family transcriptional regulator [Ktedonobacter sp. SOSP1-85]